MKPKSEPKELRQVKQSPEQQAKPGAVLRREDCIRQLLNRSDRYHQSIFGLLVLLHTTLLKTTGLVAEVPF
jgi:hypothetical protein